ncbi:hypothetical protein HZS_3810 [Henneguya salminicola]|nr:hypothetical protein HZS_3810 [Henneguya salminicola]
MSMENSPSGSQDITNSLRSTPEINSFPTTSYESVSSISQNPLICSSLNEKNPTSILGKSAKKKGLHQNRSLRNKIKNQSQDFPEPFSLPKCNLPNNARDFKTLDTLKIALRDFINKIIENENEIEKKSILFTRANMIAT